MSVPNIDDIIELSVTSLGGLGDGIGHYNDKPVYVPLSCAGDRISAKITAIHKDHYRAMLHEVITPSQDRAAPPCTHFGECGGCSLQHVSEPAYQSFKRSILQQAIESLGEDEQKIAPLISVGEGARRRVEFKVAVHKKDITLGFVKAKTNEVLAITACKVADQKIVELLPALEQQLHNMKKAGRIHAISITVLEEGMELCLHLKASLLPVDIEKWALFAKAHEIVRVTLMREDTHEYAVVHQTAPTITLGGVAVELPVGAFLQASAKAQQIITDLVLEYSKGYNKVADLYCGCGTYSFPLVQAGHEVRAFEGSADMVQGAQNAAIRAEVDARITLQSRDLYKSSLKVDELQYMDAVVINPPRNGAKPQFQQIAKSGVSRVIVVSCNPITFARDAACLKEAGYQLQHAVPIDQFHWSAHLECVAIFDRK